MNTDSLGGGRVTTGDVDATNTSSTFKTSNTTIEATEGRVTFGTANMGTAMQAHATANSGGTWSIATNATDSSALFEIDASSGAVTLNSSTPVAELNFDTTTPANNTLTFAVQYTQGGTTVTDNITLNITDKAVATSNTSGTAELTVEEGDCIKIYSVDTTDGGTAQSGIFSDQFQEFVAANPGATFAVGAHSNGTDDSGQITLNTATGAMLANLDFERATDTGANNVYEFSVTATSGGVTVTENVTLTVTDDDAAQVTLAASVNHTDVAAAAGADGAAIESTSNTYTAADTVAARGEIAADIDSTGTGTVSLTWAQLDSMLTGGGSDGVSEWITDQGSATITYAISGNTGSGVSLTTGNAGIDIDEATAADTDGVQITLTNGGEIFTFDLDFDFTDTTSQTAAAIATANAGALTRSGEHSTLDARAGGEALTVDLKVGSTGTTTDSHFNGIGDAYVADPCGTFELVANTAAFNGSTSHANAANVTVSADGNFSLAAGAAEGTYSALVKYTDNDGDATYERIDLNTVDIGEASGNDIATATALTAAAATRQSTEQIAGTSTLAMAEARQGNITSTGTGAVLSAAFNTFTSSYTGGTYSVSGTDAASFSINAATGALETSGLVDFETKNSYSMTVTYTSGDNSYSEDVTIAVTNNTVDDGTHITNVDLGTQAGSATAVGILDTAINQISESQAKLGAIQNRLQYNIDNLSKASMLTTTAKGRIMDADFASETSELSKQQILSQAATSMLAQANQSKQSVLALLQ